jgi:hypothetical protein
MASGGSRRDEGKARFWRGEIEGQARSGQSVRAYCRAHRLGEATFYHWRRELARRGPATFVPVTVATETAGPSRATGAAAEEAPGGRLEILVASGRRILVTGPVDRVALAEVLAVVEGRPC